MFNKSEGEVALECAILNAKLRLHEGGPLNGSEKTRPVVLALHPTSVSQPDYLKLIIGLITIVLSFILIGKLFSK